MVFHWQRTDKKSIMDRSIKSSTLIFLFENVARLLFSRSFSSWYHVYLQVGLGVASVGGEMISGIVNER